MPEKPILVTEEQLGFFDHITPPKPVTNTDLDYGAVVPPEEKPKTSVYQIKFGFMYDDLPVVKCKLCGHSHPYGCEVRCPVLRKRRKKSDASIDAANERASRLEDLPYEPEIVPRTFGRTFSDRLRDAIHFVNGWTIGG